MKCWFGRHAWVIRAYPSRFTEGRKYAYLPLMIVEPLIWRVEYEECSRCGKWRWQFADAAAHRAWSDAIGASLRGPR